MDIKLFLIPKLSAKTSKVPQLLKRCGFLHSNLAYSIINIHDLSPRSKALFKNFCFSKGLSASVGSRLSISISSIIEWSFLYKSFTSLQRSLIFSASGYIYVSRYSKIRYSSLSSCLFSFIFESILFIVDFAPALSPCIRNISAFKSLTKRLLYVLTSNLSSTASILKSISFFLSFSLLSSNSILSLK